MGIKFEAFKGAAGASTDNLDDVTSRGSSTTNSITVGGVTIGTEYSLPSVDGSPDQYIKSDGAGNLSFASLDITGGLVYQGSFNATTGTTSLGTTLANAEKGDFYLIDTAGTIYGKDWNVGDHLLINADMGGSITNSKIDKIDNTETTATEDVAGVIEIATNTEATAASATNRALVPSNISSIALSSFNNDLSFVQNGDNVSVLTNDAGYLTSVASASETAEGIIETATNAEATAAAANNKALVPSNIQHIALSSFDDDLSYLSSGDNVSVLTNDAGYLTGISSESLNDLSDVSYTAGAGIDNYVLTYDHSTTSWGAEAASGGGGSAPTVTTPATLTADYTISTNSGIREIFAFTSTANRAITLPTASTVGEGYQYDIKSLSNVTFTITCAGSDTIDDGSSTTFELTDQYSSITLVADSDNNRWFIV